MMDSSKLIPLIVSALQEVDRQLQAEKEKTATLQSQYDNLLERIISLESR